MGEGKAPPTPPMFLAKFANGAKKEFWGLPPSPTRGRRGQSKKIAQRRTGKREKELFGGALISFLSQSEQDKAFSVNALQKAADTLCLYVTYIPFHSLKYPCLQKSPSLTCQRGGIKGGESASSTTKPRPTTSPKTSRIPGNYMSRCCSGL